MKFKCGIVGGHVEGNEEGPPPVVTAVLVALVEDIAVEEESISRFQFHMKQREYLRWRTNKYSIRITCSK